MRPCRRTAASPDLPCWHGLDSLGDMTTPQQFIESFLQEKAAAYAESNVRLVSLHAKYFGESLLKHTRDFLLHDGVDAVFEDVKQSAGSATAITRERLRRGD